MHTRLIMPNLIIVTILLIFIMILPFNAPFLSSLRASKKILEENNDSDVEEDSSEDKKYDDNEYEDHEYDESEEEFDVEYEFGGSTKVGCLISTYKNQELKNANKKNEISNNIKFEMRGEYFELKTDMNLLINSNVVDKALNDEYKYSSEYEISRNFRISDKAYEINFKELYVGYGLEDFRLRAGNQMYGWGTADVQNPTSYFNPLDMRNFFSADPEENMKLAVPSISGMLFFGDYNLEVVFVPVHNPMLLAEKDNFWAIEINDLFPVEISEPKGMDIEPDNFAYGGRISGNILDADMSISAYRGPDIEPIIRPMGTLTPVNEPVSLSMKPEYYNVNYFGYDLAISRGKSVIQFETAYSYNKTAVVANIDEMSEIDDPQELNFPFNLKKSHYISYIVGINYFIPLEKIFEGHDGESLLIIQWFQSKYFNSRLVIEDTYEDSKFIVNEDKELMPSIMTDILTIGYTDNYFRQQLKIMLVAIFDTNNPGMMLMPRIGFDFLNGLTVTVSCLYIKDTGDKDTFSFFGYFDDHDVVGVEARYEY